MGYSWKRAKCTFINSDGEAFKFSSEAERNQDRSDLNN